MTDEQIFEWMDELCKEAVDKGEHGDLAVMNRLGANPAIGYYLNNVYLTKSVSKPTYAAMTYMPETRRVYAEYQEATLREQKEAAREAKETVRDEKFNGLEDKVDKLTDLVTKLLESNVVPAKKSGKKTTEATEETEE